LSERHIVGIRVERQGPIRFVWTSCSDLELMTPVVVEVDGSISLGFVALPAHLIVSDAEFAIRGHLVGAGPDDPIVERALRALEQDTINNTRKLADVGIDIQAVSWSIDRARLDLTLDSGMSPIEPEALCQLRSALARHFRSEIRFRRPDGTVIEVLA
jgi:hypothetical protein